MIETLKAHRLATGLLIAHYVALVFGLIGLLIMLPNPHLWQGDPRGLRVFNWSIENAGATHIILGALAVFAFGVWAIGLAKTAIFFVVSCSLSLISELVGTGTGWPFGNYEYTDFLGYKVLDRVPYTIPLSWFYMGLVCYLLGVALVQRFGIGWPAIMAILAGGWLLTVWDLVLDPAMAHDSLTIKFWEWSQTGAYFGMPVRNFIGWTLTAVAFMAVSRLLWREDVNPRSFPMLVPFVVYGVNTIFAMALSLSVGLWIPVILSLVLGVIPAATALTLPPREQRKKSLRLAPDG